MTRLRRTSRRWDDDYGIPRGSGIIDRERVIGCIGREARHVIRKAIDEINTHPRVVGTSVSQRLSNDHSRSINSEMELFPGTLATSTVLGCRPLAFAEDGQPSAVDEQMDRFLDWNEIQADIEALTTPREGGVVGSFKINIHRRKNRP